MSWTKRVEPLGIAVESQPDDVVALFCFGEFPFRGVRFGHAGTNARTVHRTVNGLQSAVCGLRSAVCSLPTAYCLPSTVYSSLSATVGARREARRAGSQLASSVTALPSADHRQRDRQRIPGLQIVQEGVGGARREHARAGADDAGRPRAAPPPRGRSCARPAPVGAERHAHADFDAAARDHVRHHAVQPDRRDQHARPPKNADSVAISRSRSSDCSTCVRTVWYWIDDRRDSSPRACA